MKTMDPYTAFALLGTEEEFLGYLLTRPTTLEVELNQSILSDEQLRAVLYELTGDLHEDLFPDERPTPKKWRCVHEDEVNEIQEVMKRHLNL